ncbi:UDP-glycosyltransferase 76B1 [Bienertia sinuspersici]
MNKLGCRIILFPKPYVGHVTPMLNLGNALYSKGFSITIIQSRLNSPDPTAFPNFTFHYMEEAMSSEALASSLDPWETVTLLNTRFIAPFRDSLSQILADGSTNEEPIACLILDPLWDFAGTVADEFSLPRLALRTGGLLAYVLYDSVPLLWQKGYFPLQENEQEAEVLEIPPLKVKDLPSEAYHDGIAAVVKETKSYHLGVICNTFEELEGTFADQFRRSLPCIPVFPIGPMHKISSTCISIKHDKDYSSITWLDTQAPNSVLYVSFGTLAAISKEQFLEVAWGLAKSKQPFLWVVRNRLINGTDTDDDTFPKDFLETVSGRSHIVTWAPQQDVLAHPSVGGFWTHCGWNSTIESICEGVPMICLPFFGDQKMNARHVSDILRIGLLLEKDSTRQEIKCAIRRLMVENEGKLMRERTANLKEKAQSCLMEGGSSFIALDQLTNHILSLCCADRNRR